MNIQCVPLAELLKATGGSIYKLAILVAKRGIELADGGKSLLDKPDERVLNTALAEIIQKRVKMGSGPSAKKDKE